MKEITFTTEKDLELIDITDKVGEIVEEAGVKEGIALIYPLHATAAVTICESYDPNMLKDLRDKIKELFPKGAGYRHDKIDDNAHSHLISSFLNPAQIVPVKDGKLYLGTWQAIIFVEADGPKQRRVLVEVVKTK